ncbi:hypothetical protein EJB05_44450, partial [Eragrostis curvula]
MGFHITQPGSSVATSLIDGEAKPKHVLLLEIKGNQYIPLRSVRPFKYAEVRNLIEKSSQPTGSRSEPKLPLVRIKVANPQDILIFSKSAKKCQTAGEHGDDSEKLCPEELNQQTIEALVAESNLVILKTFVPSLSTEVSLFLLVGSDRVKAKVYLLFIKP